MIGTLATAMERVEGVARMGWTRWRCHVILGYGTNPNA